MQTAAIRKGGCFRIRKKTALMRNEKTALMQIAVFSLYEKKQRIDAIQYNGEEFVVSGTPG